MRVALVLGLLCGASALTAGCIYAEPGPTRVEGRVEGYAPTQAALKLEVRDAEDHLVVVHFDRRDWYVSALAKRVDGREVQGVTIEAMEREVMGEVAAVSFVAPDSLNGLRYDAMGATAQQRAAWDAEYDALLASVGPPSFSPDAEVPAVAVPR